MIVKLVLEFCSITDRNTNIMTDYYYVGELIM